MLRERNAFMLKARGDERLHALTLHVNVREQDLEHFNATKTGGGTAAVEVRGVGIYLFVICSLVTLCDFQRLLELLDGDEAFQMLVKELDNVRQLEQLVKAKMKDDVRTLESAAMTAQWQVSDEPGLPSVLQRLQLKKDTKAERPSESHALKGQEGGLYRPLPVRKLAVAVWMYPPHVAIPPTGERIPTNDRSVQDFFVGVDEGS
ncbi:hypothetical protein BBJ28_00001085 [Nothophytophthora sp. Chile5]|nr:hypothetical protein BBJ28_00001085 [Nothophytophthora sp. Chile5]